MHTLKVLSVAWTNPQQAIKISFSFAGKPEELPKDYITERIMYLMDEGNCWYINTQPLKKATTEWMQQFSGLKLTFTKRCNRLCVKYYSFRKDHRVNATTILRGKQKSIIAQWGKSCSLYDRLLKSRQKVKWRWSHPHSRNTANYFIIDLRKALEELVQAAHVHKQNNLLNIETLACVASIINAWRLIIGIGITRIDNKKMSSKLSDWKLLSLQSRRKTLHLVFQSWAIGMCTD